MYTLEAYEAFRIDKPQETYIYEILPLGEGVATISSDDSLRLFDPLALHSPVNVIKSVNHEVTCISAFENNGGLMVCTAGRDGRIGIVDPRTGTKVGELATDSKAPLLSLATSGQTHSIASGTELVNGQASVLMWDIRFPDQPRLQYVESHSDDVTVLQYHPTQKQVLLSGSTDGLVNLFDTTVEEEEEALYQTINHGASIHHSGFLTEVDIFAISHDERFSTTKMVTDTNEEVEEPPTVQFGDLRENLGCEYVTNVLARPGGGAVAGIGNHSREAFRLVQLLNEPPWEFKQESAVDLFEAHSSDIIRSFCFLDEHKTILTAGEDGQIKAWKSD